MCVIWATHAFWAFIKEFTECNLPGQDHRWTAIHYDECSVTMSMCKHCQVYAYHGRVRQDVQGRDASQPLPPTPSGSSFGEAAHPACQSSDAVVDIHHRPLTTPRLLHPLELLPQWEILIKVKEFLRSS